MIQELVWPTVQNYRENTGESFLFNLVLGSIYMDNVKDMGWENLLAA
ncbi:MAG TPA: hypothetical protein PK161_06125 [Candidatus Cloacimonadota bacterium]|nr:hypothetical protein [Candidatus Cloacimonadota bacterium]